jgi:hypothetical protein
MAFSVGAVSPEQYQYLACEELLKAAREEHRRLRAGLDAQHRAGRKLSLTPKTTRSHLRRGARGERWSYHDQAPGELFAAQDIHEYVSEIADQAAATLDESEIEQALRTLIDHAALLEALAPDGGGWRHERILLIVRCLDERSAPQRDQLAKGLLQRFIFRPLPSEDRRQSDAGETFGLDARSVYGLDSAVDAASDGTPTSTPSGGAPFRHVVGVLVEGCNAARLADMEVGTHLFADAEGRLAPVQVIAWPVCEDEAPLEVLDRCLASHHAAAMSGETDAPFRFLPIVRLYGQGNGAVLDFRTGRTTPSANANLTAMLLAALPLPPELRSDDPV